MRKKQGKAVALWTCALLAVILLLGALVLGGAYNKLKDCADKHEASVTKWSAHYGIDPELVQAVIFVESRGKHDAVSNAGAVGVMQLMPLTAKWVAQKEKLGYSEELLLDADTNIRFGCAFIAYLKTRFDSTESILAAYNAGPARVEAWLKDPSYSKNGVLTDIPYKETSDYVKKVSFLIKIYEKI